MTCRPCTCVHVIDVEPVVSAASLLLLLTSRRRALHLLLASTDLDASHCRCNKCVRAVCTHASFELLDFEAPQARALSPEAYLPFRKAAAITSLVAVMIVAVHT